MIFCLFCYDTWRHPLVIIDFCELDRETLWYLQKMLIDTGASYSIVSNEIKLFLDWIPSKMRLLQGFEVLEKMVGFSDLKVTRIGAKTEQLNFGLLNLDGVGIAGMDLLEKWGIIIDLPNRVLRRMDLVERSYTIPARHSCAAVKAAAESVFPDWCSNVKTVALSISQVWVRNKLKCVKIDAVIWIEGSDPKPHRQYKFPKEAENSIQDTVDSLVTQQALVEVHSTCNSPICPVQNADGTTWRLTVDYQQLK